MLTAFKDGFTEQYFPKTLYNGILICICGGVLAYISSSIAENYFESGFFNALVIALILGVILRNSLGTSKVVLETTDVIKIDCSVADKLSGTISVMEIDV